MGYNSVADNTEPLLAPNSTKIPLNSHRIRT